mgnify:CR=1 FL=1
MNSHGNAQIKQTHFAQQLGYKPNSIAQSLASNRTNSVGILVSELHGPFFAQMMAGIESALRAAGKHVIITTGHSEDDKEKDGIEFLISRKCDALILHVESVSDDYLIELSKGKTPIYLINRYVHSLESNCISLDNELGGYLASKSIVEQGHTNIAYIAGPQVKADARNRLKGHKKALHEKNIPFNEALFYEGDFNEIGGSKGLEKLLNTRIPFSALVCANDEMAIGALKGLKEKGLKVPDNISVTGFDDLDMANYCDPPLTTIRQPAVRMGEEAAELLFRIIEGEQPKLTEYILPFEIIIRESTRAVK